MKKNWLPTDGRTDGRTHPHKEMRGRILKPILNRKRQTRQGWRAIETNELKKKTRRAIIPFGPLVRWVEHIVCFDNLVAKSRVYCFLLSHFPFSLPCFIKQPFHCKPSVCRSVTQSTIFKQHWLWGQWNLVVRSAWSPLYRHRRQNRSPHQRSPWRDCLGLEN